MTRDDLANMLNGGTYGNEIDQGMKLAIKGTDYVVVFGASDDLMEFRGAINDEIDCYGGGVAYLNSKGLIHNDCDDPDCPYYNRYRENGTIIKAIWCPKDLNVSWAYETEIPHSTFTIWDEGEPYCIGIVFRLSDIR